MHEVVEAPLDVPDADTPDPMESAARIRVSLAGAAGRDYDIVVEAGLLNRLAEECQSVLSADAKILVLTDRHLMDRYLPAVVERLRVYGFAVFPLVIPAGEKSKSLTQAQQVYEQMLQAGFTRKDAILGLGGGVVGDLAGFCASTYHRGMQVIHVPTTLVAQVDSAIGGKTAVNFERVKNIVGTFHQPLRVLADPHTLRTLPPNELAAGMAEVIKYGLIETSCSGSAGFFHWLLRQAESGQLQASFPEMIRRCCAIKAAVVQQDEFETQGLRFFLNLGHTFGHAYESLSYYSLLHGEAVAIGLLKAVRLSARLELFPAAVEAQLRAFYQQVGLSEVVRRANDYGAISLLEKMKQDKKNRDARIRLVLPVEEPGKVLVWDDIPEETILEVLAERL